MREIPSALSTPQLVKAIEANFYDFWEYVGRSPLVDLCVDSDMIRFTTEVPSPICNMVLRASLSKNDIDTRIDNTVAHFQSRGMPIRWFTSPSTRPVDLGNALAAHGFAHLGYVTGMAVNLLELNEELSAPSDLTIEHVRDVHLLGKMMQTLAIGYGIPVSVGNLFVDIFSQNEKPVACSSLFLSAGVAGIFVVATVEQARGQGIGSALTLIPLLEARELGYKIGVLGSSEMGSGVYRRLGFRDLFKFNIYISKG